MVDRSQPARIIDQPEPCFIRLQLVRGGVFVAARIFRRLGMLVGEINGAPADIFQIWHGGDFIDEETYNGMMRNPHPDPYRQVHMSSAGLAERIREQDETDWWLTQPIR